MILTTKRFIKFSQDSRWLSSLWRGTHRISIRRRMERVSWMEQRVFKTLQDNRILYPDDLEIWLGQIRGTKAITWKRGKLRVKSIALFVDSLILTGKLGWFWISFRGYHAIYQKLKRLCMVRAVLLRLFGPDLFETGKLKFTWRFWYLVLAHLVFGYREPRVQKMMDRSRAILRQLPIEKPNRLLRHFTKTHPVFRVLMDMRKHFQDFLPNMPFGLTFNPDTDPGWALGIVDQLPTFGTSLFGERRLTRPQLAKLARRNLDVFRVIIWTLMYHKPLLRTDFNLTGKCRLTLELSFKGIAIYKHFSVMNDGRWTLIRPVAFRMDPLFKHWTPSAQVFNAIAPIFDNYGKWDGSKWKIDKELYGLLKSKIGREVRRNVFAFEPRDFTSQGWDGIFGKINLSEPPINNGPGIETDTPVANNKDLSMAELSKMLVEQFGPDVCMVRKELHDDYCDLHIAGKNVPVGAVVRIKR